VCVEYPNNLFYESVFIALICLVSTIGSLGSAVYLEGLSTKSCSPDQGNLGYSEFLFLLLEDLSVSGGQRVFVRLSELAGVGSSVAEWLLFH